jgi:hypothetical protein
LTIMSADELAGLPNAKTLDEVKYLVAVSTLKPVEAVDGPRPGEPQDGVLLEKLNSLQTEMRREFQMQQREMQEKHQVLQADLLEARQTLERMQVSMLARAGEFEAKLASLNRDISIGSARLADVLKHTADDLKQTKDIVHSHSRMWERLGRRWPIRVLLHLSKAK